MKNVIVVCIAALALVGCKKETGALVDPALSTLVPADTTLLVGIRVEDLMKTPIYQKYLANRPIGPVDDFTKQTGLNVRANLWEILYISNGKENVILGRGKFSNEAEPRLDIPGATRSNYRGFTLIGDDKRSVLLMGPSLMGVGDTAGLKRIIDTRDKTNGPPAVLAERMKDVPREAGIWSVFTGAPIPLSPNASANMGNLVKILDLLESGSAYLDLRSGISGKTMGITPNDQNGKELYDSLRGILGLARMAGAKDDVALQRLLDGLRITQDGRTVNLYIEEQEDAVNLLFDFITRTTSGRTRPAVPAQKGK
jgi:hypothetical protein